MKRIVVLVARLVGSIPSSVRHDIWALATLRMQTSHRVPMLHEVGLMADLAAKIDFDSLDADERAALNAASDLIEEVRAERALRRLDDAAVEREIDFWALTTDVVEPGTVEETEELAAAA